MNILDAGRVFVALALSGRGAARGRRAGEARPRQAARGGTSGADTLGGRRPLSEG